jgi:hypothetical protein
LIDIGVRGGSSNSPDLDRGAGKLINDVESVQLQVALYTLYISI